MRNWMKISIAMVAALGIILQALPSRALDFSPNEMAKLKEGKPVKKPLANSGKGGFYGGTGFALIDAPAEQVWEAVLDWGSYHRVYPKTVSVKEVSRKGNRSLVRMKLGHKLLSIDYHVDVRVNHDKWQIDYKLVTSRPHDIEEAHGYWRLFPQKGGKTLVAYVAAVRVPMGIVNLIPKSMEEKISRNLLSSPHYLSKWLQGPSGNRYTRGIASRGVHRKKTAAAI